MTTNVSFARAVIETMRLYENGRQILRRVERRLERQSLAGFPVFQDIPAVRAFNLPPGDGAPTLGCLYVFLPTADFLPTIDRDESFVFCIGRPRLNKMIALCDHERRECLDQIFELYKVVSA